MSVEIRTARSNSSALIFGPGASRTRDHDHPGEKFTANVTTSSPGARFSALVGSGESNGVAFLPHTHGDESECAIGRLEFPLATCARDEISVAKHARGLVLVGV